MNRKESERYTDALRQLADGHATLIAQYELTICLLRQEIDDSPVRTPSSSAFAENDWPAIDQRRLTVDFRGRHCFLGNTIPLRLFQRLLQRPNQFIAHRELLDDVWRGIRSSATIRSAVKVLRKQLRKADMADLAQAIDGHVAGHYGLMLQRLGS